MLHACLMTICGRYTLTDRISISHFISIYFLKTQFLGLAADGGLLLGHLWRAHPDVTPLITVHFPSFVNSFIRQGRGGNMEWTQLKKRDSWKHYFLFCMGEEV